MPLPRLFLASLLIIMGFPALGAESSWVRTEHAKTRLVSEGLARGGSQPVALELVMQEGWHTYTEPPGDAGLATSIEWELPPGFTATGIYWPPHETIKEGTLTTYGYHGEVKLPVNIFVPGNYSGAEAVVKARATWLICNDICIPEEAKLELKLPVKDGGGAGNETMSLLPALLLAFVGGLILNLMPCVFPVLSLKCLAVVKQAELHPREAKLEGLAYTLGILLCFDLIAGGLLVLQQGGAAIGWGYQMQSPVFVTVLALLLFGVGLNLSGLFDLPVLLGNVRVTRGGARGSFFTGILATLVATPCTAPFMASAVGYALTQPWYAAFAVFEMLGLGLATPFLLVSFFPKLRALLPKPGAWMERFKQLLAFPMYASVVWLLWVLAQQSGANGIGAALLAMLGVVFALWLAKIRRWIAVVVAVLAIGGTLLYLRDETVTAASGIAQEGEAYSEAKLAELRAQGKPVFIDATAAWCITCRVNHFSTLRSVAVQEAFARKGVTLLIADWTNRNEAVTKLLQSFGYSGVPLYVYYPPKGEPKILPQVLTPDIVIGAME